MKHKLFVVNYYIPFTLLLVLFFTIPLKAQLIISENGTETSAKSFSLLEIISTQGKDGGLRLPPLTTFQRDSIARVWSSDTSGSAKGLVIFNTDTHCLEFWNGDHWVSLCSDSKETPVTPVVVPTGSGTLSGRTCFDIASPDNDGKAGCGTLAGRTWKADFSDINTYKQTYTFRPTGQVSKVRFAYVESNRGNIVESMDYSTAYETATGINYDCAVTINYKTSLNNLARGLTNSNPLKLDIYALYNDNKDGTGTNRIILLTAKIKDCNCCGAYSQGGVWLNLMCHNLGSDPSLDPFTYDSKGDNVSFDIKGNLYQWGRKVDGYEARNSGVVYTQATGYDPLTPAADAGKFIAGASDWLTPRNDNLLGDNKTNFDPCPFGWQIPSQSQWQDINDANTWKWTANGYMVGDQLFLPAAGFRNFNLGAMENVGVSGSYWSSTSSTTNALPLYYSYDSYFTSGGNDPKYDADRGRGVSVRCVQSDIDATPASIWLSPSTGNTAKTIQIFSDTTWTVVASPANASLSSTSGLAGITTITLTRSDTQYGSESFVINNLNGKTITVNVDNFYIEEDELNISNNAPTGNTGTYAINVYGGSQTFTIVSASDWITSAQILPDGQLQLIANQSSDGEPRTGYITLAHADDPTYQVTFSVIQGYDVIPPFDYLVLKFTWSGSDVDIAVEFTGQAYSPVQDPPYPPFVNYPYTEPTSDQKAVGWYLQSSIGLDGAKTIYSSSTTNDQVTNNTTLMMWGGDATGGQGETVFFKAPLITPTDPIHDDQNLPRYITLDAYAVWYTTASVNSPVKLAVYTYTGGTMLKPSTNNTTTPPSDYTGGAGIYTTNFYNVPEGTVASDLANGAASYALLNPPAFSTDKNLVVNRASGSVNQPMQFRNTTSGYTRMATITYDRYRHSATVTWIAPELTGVVLPYSTTIVDPDSPPKK